VAIDFDFNTSGSGSFTSPALSASKNAWNTPVSVDPADGISASGQDLKNVLQAFNMNQLITSADASQVAWTGPTDVHPNNATNYWVVAHNQLARGNEGLTVRGNLANEERQPDCRSS
jgi:hypothetical protein